MNITLAETDSDIAACFPLMHELRPHLLADRFVAQLRDQQRQGYQLAFLRDTAQPLALAGFRILHNLAWGRFLYVDDLVTAAAHRSAGHGSRMLQWLTDFAAQSHCAQLHLDSGTQRLDAHRFYQREGMAITCQHFVITLARGG